MSGTQWPAEKSGSVHSTTATLGSGRPATAAVTRDQPGPQAHHKPTGVWLAARCRSDGDDRAEDFFQGAGVDRKDLAVAAEMAKRGIDSPDVNSARRTEVLGDDKVGTEVMKSALV